MNDRNWLPQAATTEQVFQSPIFGLIPLRVAAKRWPRRYRRFDEAALGLLHVGSYVKVLATSLGDVKTQEEVWLIIRQMSPLRTVGKHIGEITFVHSKKDGKPERLGRTKYHGLDAGMMIYFQLADVIDMRLNRIEAS